MSQPYPKPRIPWWVFLTISIVAALFIFGGNSTIKQGVVKEISTTELYKTIENGSVKTILIDPQTLKVSGELKDGSKFHTTVSDVGDLEKHAIKHGVEVKTESVGGFSWWNIVPYILFIGLFLWLFVGVGSQGKSMKNQVGGFLNSRSRFVAEKHNITFADVAGCDEAKEEVAEIIDFLKRPQVYLEKGAKIPRGILLAGLPGTGKTLMARALSGEAGVAMIECSASEFIEMFVGVGSARVRDLFAKAREAVPCVIFIDELDAIGKSRGYATVSHDEREQTLNELLVQMDGFKENEGIVVIGATNRADVLDDALIRPGRFDRKVFLNLPDVKGREAILKVHIRKRKVPMAEGVDLVELAKLTPFLSGADLENIVNEAAVQSVRGNHKKVTVQDFKEAIDRFLYGPQKKSRVVIENERQIAAYHEAGHAVVGRYMEGADPIQKITIIPRGEAAGVTFFLPEHERSILPKKYLLARLAILMGGRVGEMLKFNDESSGAFSDFYHATNIAKSMVCGWGMSEKIGKISINEHSNQTKEISAEIKKLTDEAYEKANEIVKQHLPEWEAIAQALLEKETLNKEEVEKIFKTTI